MYHIAPERDELNASNGETRYVQCSPAEAEIWSVYERVGEDWKLVEDFPTLQAARISYPTAPICNCNDTRIEIT